MTAREFLNMMNAEKGKIQQEDATREAEEDRYFKEVGEIVEKNPPRTPRTRRG